jgi:hypothetical protein
MKKKKLVKQALEHPELHTPGELAFFKRWLLEKKLKKTAKINKNNEVDN